MAAVPTGGLSLGEAMTLAEAAGLDLDRVLGVLEVTDFRSPIFDGVGPAVLEDDYEPAFALDLMVKDVGLIQQLADSLDVPMPGTATVADTLAEAQRRGHGSENASALVKVIADRAGVSLARSDPDVAIRTPRS